MLQSLNLPLYSVTKTDYGCWDTLRDDCRQLGCDGVEGIWAGEDIPVDFPADLLTGYHLTFFPDWLDFYREDTSALLRKFGSPHLLWIELNKFVSSDLRAPKELHRKALIRQCYSKRYGIPKQNILSCNGRRSQLSQKF